MRPDQERLSAAAQEALVQVARRFDPEVDAWRLEQYADEYARWYPAPGLLNLHYFPVVPPDLRPQFVEDANAAVGALMGSVGPGLREVAVSACRELGALGSRPHAWLLPFHLGIHDLLGSPILYQTSLDVPVLLGDPLFGRMVLVRDWLGCPRPA